MRYGTNQLIIGNNKHLNKMEGRGRGEITYKHRKTMIKMAAPMNKLRNFSSASSF